MSREIIVDAIRNMGRSECGLNEDQPDFHLRRELASKLSVVSFRRLGLLGALNEEFAGDIPLAVVSSFPDAFGQPLLHLDNFRPYDHLYEKWLQREAEIEDRIRLKTHSRMKEVLIGSGGKPIDQGNRANPHKKPTQYYTVSKFAYRKNLDDLSEEEDRDLKTVYDVFLKSGHTACYLFGGYDVTTLMLMSGRVGKLGRVYYVTREPQLEEQLFNSMAVVLGIFSRMKGINPRRRGILPTGMAERITDYFTPYFKQDLEFYGRGYPDEEVKRMLKSFYRRYHLFPINQNTPPFPPEIRSGSVDVLVECDRFAGVDETKKEALLWEIDRILRPGGKILFREGSREQTEIEYYGQEMFNRGYERWFPPRTIKHAARWIIFRKFTQEEQGKSHKLSLDDFTREIVLSQQDSPTPLSLSWFKKKGLLPFLVSQFNGNIEDAFNFVLPKQPVEDTEENTVLLPEISPPIAAKDIRDSVREPQGGKLFYTVKDLANDLDAKKGAIQNTLKRVGIKSLRHRSFSRPEITRSQIRFSPSEYETLKRMLQSDLAGTRNKRKGGQNG